VTGLIALLAAQQQQGGLGSILILILPLAAIVYLMVIPQRKQRQKQQAFLSKLEVGDEVVTSGGIYGTINHLEDGIAHLQIDTETVIRISVSSLSRSAAAEPDGKSDSSADEGSSSPRAADRKKKQAN